MAKIVTDQLILAVDAANKRSYESGTSWHDLSASNLTGTLTNGPTFSDLNGGFISLDGSNDYINVGDAGTLDITGDMTISCWVSLGSAENGNFAVILSKRYNSDSTTPFTMFFDDRGSGNGVNRFGWYMGNSSTSIGAQADSNFDGVYDKWDHVVGTVSGTTMSLYVNGVLSTTATFSGSRQTNGVGVKIGGPYNDGSSDYMLSGNISVATIQNTALSAVQVKQLYDYFKHRYGK